MSNTSVQQKIPKNIVQYWTEENLPSYLIELSKSFSLVYPDFNYQLFNRNSAIVFLKKHYDMDISNAFKSLKVPAMQSDFFRVAYLLVEGGMYVDISHRAHIKIDDLIFKIDKLFVFTRPTGAIINGIILAPKENELLSLIFERILKNIARKDSFSAYQVTGPANFNRILTASNCIMIEKHAMWKYIRGDKLYSREKLYTEKNTHWSEMKNIADVYE
ncbi:glycosyltransferase [Psychrobacter sp. BI730]|uniref:glycosyltransferase family 32 protein n=1 Tax=Psychrobacter sp. BI730 TaxID=2705463 RepID=UPI0015CE5B89|nr:glycosyltransferase [Psychrobacter sp. BI730]NYR10793.1 hypothetical protein [Psychrobacter sp. BI730]